MGKKEIISILIILVLLGVIGYLSIIQVTPPSNQYKYYVISGKVLPSEKIIGNQPEYVYVYYPYYIPNHLCRSSDIQLSNIDWLDNTTGQYNSYFKVPIGLNEVILTADCSSCDYKVLNLTNIPTSFDLMWGSKKCEDDFQVGDQKTQVLEHARNFLNGIEANIVNKPFNSAEMQSIKQDIEKGREAISESDRINDKNESLLQSYYAEWFAWRAQYKIELFELKYCAEQVDTILESHKDGCYVPDYNAYNDYSSANSTYHSLSSSGLLKEYPFDIKELEKMKLEISYLHNQEEWISGVNMKCGNGVGIINGTFEFQKPYCEARNITVNITFMIWAIVFVYIGILIEKGRTLWKK